MIKVVISDVFNQHYVFECDCWFKNSTPKNVLRHLKLNEPEFYTSIVQILVSIGFLSVLALLIILAFVANISCNRCKRDNEGDYYLFYLFFKFFTLTLSSSSKCGNNTNKF